MNWSWKVNIEYLRQIFSAPPSLLPPHISQGELSWWEPRQGSRRGRRGGRKGGRPGRALGLEYYLEYLMKSRSKYYFRSFPNIRSKWKYYQGGQKWGRWCKALNRLELRRQRRAGQGEAGGSPSFFRFGILSKVVEQKSLCVLRICNCELVLSQVWARVKTQLRSIATDLPSAVGEGVSGRWGFPAKCWARGRSGSGAVNNGWKKFGKTKTLAIAIVLYAFWLNLGRELDVCFELPC